jgi:PEGA domain
VRINTSPPGATAALGGLGAKKTPVTFNANPGKYSLFIELDGYEPIAREVEVKEGQLSDLETITLQPGKSRIDLSSAPPGAKIFQGGILLGVTPFRRDDFPSGRTTFLLVSEGYLPREFTARLDSKELFKATIPLAKPLSVYKGTIGGSVPITIKLGADLKSGTMAQSSTRGETVVKFAGVWTGATLRAVTRELLSKPESILWEPESFTLRFSDDGKNVAYECNYGTEVFTASLGAP